jgi:hypothetical protein
MIDHLKLSTGPNVTVGQGYYLEITCPNSLYALFYSLFLSDVVLYLLPFTQQSISCILQLNKKWAIQEN